MVLTETPDYSDRILKYNCNFSGQGRPHGGGGRGNWDILFQAYFVPGPSLKGAPGGPIRGPLNTCLKKDRYTLIEQSGSRPFLAPRPLFNSLPWANP